MTYIQPRSKGPRPTALVHTRVSTDRQAKDGNSLKTQESLVYDHCDLQGWDVIEHIHEDGDSAFKGPRPEFERAIDIMSSTDIDFFVSPYVDRLFRNVHHMCHIDEQSREEGWYLAALQMGGGVIETRDPMGWYMLLMMTGQAEFDSRFKSVRVSQGMKRKRDEGTYRYNQPVISDKVMKRMRNLRSRGWSYGEISKKLNSEGVPTPRGAPQWTRANVRSALTYERVLQHG